MALNYSGLWDLKQMAVGPPKSYMIFGPVWRWYSGLSLMDDLRIDWDLDLSVDLGSSLPYERVLVRMIVRGQFGLLLLAYLRKSVRTG